MLNFSEALQALEEGKIVTRECWTTEFIYLVPGSEFPVNRPPLLGIYDEGVTVKYHKHIDMRQANGVCVYWTPTQVDIFADDYQIIAK